VILFYENIKINRHRRQNYQKDRIRKDGNEITQYRTNLTKKQKTIDDILAGLFCFMLLGMHVATRLQAINWTSCGD